MKANPMEQQDPATLEMRRDQADLFATYPDAPGYSEPDTSRAAAESMADSAPRLRERVLAALRRNGPMTPDEAADGLSCSVLSIRPRFTELSHAGLIEDTGERRANDSGRAAKVWRAA